MSASELVQRKIERLHADLDERLEKLRARRDEVLKQGYEGSPAQAEKIVKEIDQIKGVYQAAFARAALELQNAEDFDAQKKVEAIARQQRSEDASKDAARVAWTRSGGKPEEFDAVWPEIRKTQLENLTLRELEKSENSRPPIRL
jgi:BMFP domain-containing protein YqiC